MRFDSPDDGIYEELLGLAYHGRRVHVTKGHTYYSGVLMLDDDVFHVRYTNLEFTALEVKWVLSTGAMELYSD